MLAQVYRGSGGVVEEVKDEEESLIKRELEENEKKINGDDKKVFEEDEDDDGQDVLFPEEKQSVNILEVAGEDNWAQQPQEVAYARGNVETLTFKIKDQPGRGPVEARIAISVFGTLGALILISSVFITLIVLIFFRPDWMRLYFALLPAPFGALLRHIIVSKNVKFGPNTLPWYVFCFRLFLFFFAFLFLCFFASSSCSFLFFLSLSLSVLKSPLILGSLYSSTLWAQRA